MTTPEKMLEGLSLFFNGFAEILNRAVKAVTDFANLINMQPLWEMRAINSNNQEVKRLYIIYGQTKKVRIKNKLRKRIGKILDK
ncbi:hypothetical protein [Carnobacterium maltaromaticum]|uniref:hypothetical protein n=1 Tax=Carnobacterium maltaromaticum TaxID=2751 RepID=UPI0039B09154